MATGAAAKKVEKPLAVGDRVVAGANNSQLGTVRFIGMTQFAPGPWVGIELDDPTGKNNGSVGDVAYFLCPDKCGLFVKPTMVKRAPTTTAATTTTPTASAASPAPATAPAPAAVPATASKPVPVSKPTAAAPAAGASAAPISGIKKPASSPTAPAVAASPAAAAPVPGPTKLKVSATSDGASTTAPKSPARSGLHAPKAGTASASPSSASSYVSKPKTASSGIAKPKAATAAGTASKTSPTTAAKPTLTKPTSSASASPATSGTDSASDEVDSDALALDTAADDEPTEPGETTGTAAGDDDTAAATGDDDDLRAVIASAAAEEDEEPEPAASSGGREPVLTPAKNADPSTASSSSAAATLSAKREDLKKKKEKIEMLKSIKKADTIGGGDDDDAVAAARSLLKQQYDQQLDNLKRELTETQGQLKDLKEKINVEKQNSKQAVKAVEDEKHDLQSMAEDLTVHKAELEEQLESAKTELETIKEDLEGTKLELELLKETNQANKNDMIESLPDDKQEVARIVDQNAKLAEAVRQLRDLSLADKEKAEKRAATSQKEIDGLKQKVKELDPLVGQLKERREEIEDLKAQLDDALESQDMVETMANKNLKLVDQLTEAQNELDFFRQLADESEDVEQAHLDLEAQLQRDLDMKSIELDNVRREFANHQGRVEDLNKTLKQFRELVLNLQTEVDLLREREAAAANMSREQSERSREVLERNLQLLNRVKEIKSDYVEQRLNKLESDQARRKFEFVKRYFPENVEIDDAAMSLLLLIERLKFKIQLTIDMLHQYYGSDVKGVTAELQLFSYTVCQLLVQYSRHLELIMSALTTGDAEAYQYACSRHKDLLPVERNLDGFLKAVTSDTISESSAPGSGSAALEPIHHGLETLRTFVADHFSDAQQKVAESEGPYGVSAVLMDARQLYDEQVSAAIHLKRLRQLITPIDDGTEQKQHHAAADGASSSVSAGPDTPKAHGSVSSESDPKTPVKSKSAEPVYAYLENVRIQLLNKLEDTQREIQQLADKLLGQTTRAMDSYVNKYATTVINYNEFRKFADACKKISAECLHRLGSMYAPLRSALMANQTKAVLSPSLYDIAEPAAIQATLEKVFGRELISSDSDIVTLFHNLQRAVQEYTQKLSASSSLLSPAATFTAADEALAPRLTPWETHAATVRQQLQEAASVKSQIETLNKQLTEKTQSFFLSEKSHRDTKTKMDLLQGRLNAVQEKMNEINVLKKEIEKYKKQELANQQTVEHVRIRADVSAETFQDEVSRDLEKRDGEIRDLKEKLAKYTQALKAERKKNKDSAKPTTPTSPGGPSDGKSTGRGNGFDDLTGGGGGVSVVAQALLLAAEDEIRILKKTLAMLRRQYSNVKNSKTRADLERLLPPLPVFSRGLGGTNIGSSTSDSESSAALAAALAPSSDDEVKEESKEDENKPLSSPIPSPRPSPAAAAAATSVPAPLSVLEVLAKVVHTKQQQADGAGSVSVAAPAGPAVTAAHRMDALQCDQLSSALATLTKRLLIMRVAPLVVDLNNQKSPAAEQWLSRQTALRRLETESTRLKQQVSALSAKRAVQAFKSNLTLSQTNNRPPNTYERTNE